MIVCIAYDRKPQERNHEIGSVKLQMSHTGTPSEETYLLSYKTMVSKLNNWQLTQELAKRVEIFDHLTEELEQLAFDKETLKIETTEKKKARVEMQIEILHRRTQPDKKREKPEGPLDLKDESRVESLVGLLATADEEPEIDATPADQHWLGELNSSVSKGILSEDEQTVIRSYKSPLGVTGTVKPGELSSAEKNILGKWKTSKNKD